MKSFEEKPHNEVAKAEFDPNDVWDNWLAEHYGQHALFEDDEEEEEKRKLKFTGEALLQAKRFDNALVNVEGDITDPDGTQFGSFFGDRDGELQIEAPEGQIPTPEEVKPWLDGSKRVRLDFTIQFQPDGPGSEGHIWQTRLFDQLEEKEVPDSRALSNKLSFAIATTMKYLPDNADEYLSAERFLSKTHDMAGYIDFTIESSEEQDDAIALKYPDYKARNLKDEIKKKNAVVADIFESGTMAQYVQDRIEEYSQIKDKEKQTEAAKKFEDEFRNLENEIRDVYEDIRNERYKFLINKGEDVFGLGNPEDDETDGWMKSPDWRG